MELYAVIECGAKQYRIKPGDKIEVEKIDKEPGKEIALDKVLLISEGGKISVGAPYISGAKVLCVVSEQTKGPKKISFKFRRRKESQVKRGHRQKLTRLEVKEIKTK
ncbi:MAG: 50S ribosomal protein L21 [Candidatus Omnitrophota bacterium]